MDVVPLFFFLHILLVVVETLKGDYAMKENCSSCNGQNQWSGRGRSMGMTRGCGNEMRRQNEYNSCNMNETGEKIIGFREKDKEDGGWINGGFMVMQPEVFQYLHEGDNCILERTPLETLAAEGKLGIYKHHGYWQCMDTQRDRFFLETHWSNGTALWKVW